jgi:hypothetical protein
LKRWPGVHAGFVLSSDIVHLQGADSVKQLGGLYWAILCRLLAIGKGCATNRGARSQNAVSDQLCGFWASEREATSRPQSPTPLRGSSPRLGPLLRLGGLFPERPDASAGLAADGGSVLLSKMPMRVAQLRNFCVGRRACTVRALFQLRDGVSFRGGLFSNSLRPPRAAARNDDLGSFEAKASAVSATCTSQGSHDSDDFLLMLLLLLRRWGTLR